MTFVEISKDQAKKELKILVERFRENIDQYQSKSYLEAHARKMFIDKFFKILGWDVDNDRALPEQYKEVVNEDSLKISGKTKAPDYGFRIGPQRKFFVEAKAPSINIKEKSEPAFQLRRYAWNAKLPLSILTDFEELAVYDCTTKPLEKDKASVSRIMYYSFEEYIDRFDEIYDIFSREAVWKGSFDRFIESAKNKRGTAQVDEDFLNEIEKWREILAKNIALRNKDLSIYELNYAVQVTIDRIIFLRICEERSMERYGKLEEISKEDDLYEKLLKYFKHADNKYNSGIFDLKNDKITTKITIDNKILKQVISELYYPKCPYEFTVIGPEILGNVYEQFLGKVIRLTSGHQAKVEEKPEVKKAGGVFYTPEYIVDYIVENTVGKVLKGKTPKQIEKIRILDPACGSGSFLLGAYNYLIDYHLNYYLKNEPKKFKKDIFQVKENQWLLTSERKKKILLNNIYGVDIDPQAVEVTKLSLLLKVLENETKESVNQQMRLIQERVLPNLDDNIKCGNSLIGPEFYKDFQLNLMDFDKSKRINIFDWQDGKCGFGKVMNEGGFDAIIGNPPYIQIQKLKEFYPEEIKFYQKHYETARERNVDIYIPFIQKSLSLLKKKGLLGFICPNRFFNSDYGKRIREHIKNFNLYHLVNFRHYFVFDKADTYTCLIFLQNKKQQKNLIYKEVRDLYKNKHEKISYFINSAKESESKFIIDKIEPHFLNQKKWYFMTEDEDRIFKKISKNDKFVNCFKLNFQGLITGMDKVFILSLISEKNKTRIFYSKALDGNIELENELTYNIIGDSNIDNYYIKNTNNFIIFPYKNGNILEDSELEKYPLIWNYLNTFKSELKKRENSKFNNRYWYQFSRNQAIDKQELSKLLIPHVVKGTRCAYDKEGKIFIKNVGVNGIQLKDEVKEEEEYFIAILNSTIASFFISKTSIFLSGGYYATNKQFAGEIPIKRIDFDNEHERRKHDAIVNLVNNLIDLKKKLNSSKLKTDDNLIKNQINAIEFQINDKLYDLYGIKKRERKIIENGIQNQ